MSNLEKHNILIAPLLFLTLCIAVHALGVGNILSGWIQKIDKQNQQYKPQHQDDTSGFPAYWSHQQQQLGYTKPNVQATGALGAQPADSGLSVGKSLGNTLPDPRKYKGVGLTAPNGQHIRSDGTQWIKE